MPGNENHKEMEQTLRAPKFQVMAIKAHAVDKTKTGRKLLHFKRKQIITVLDFDDRKDAIYGECEGNRGWFPASHVKLVGKEGNTNQTISQLSVTIRDKSEPMLNLPMLALSHDVSSDSTAPLSNRGSARGIEKLAIAAATDFPSLILQGTRAAANMPAELLKANQRGDGLSTATEDFSKNSKYVDEHGIPVILNSLIGHIKESGGMEEMNIFKNSGKPSEVQQIRSKSCDVGALDLNDFPTIAVATALKLIVTGFGEPLTTYDLYGSVTSALKIPEEDRKKDQYTYLMELIPPQYFNVAKLLSQFLYECTTHSEKNQFTIDVAGRLFGQVFCRGNDFTIDKNDLSMSSAVTAFLIEHSEAIFPNFIDVNDKKIERNREGLRKKEKELTQSYEKRERKRQAKEKKRKDAEHDTSPPPLSPESLADDERLSPVSHRRSSSVSVLSTFQTPTQNESTEVKSPRKKKNTRTRKKSTDEGNRFKLFPFYKYGFYVLLFLLFVSHLFRSVL